MTADPQRPGRTERQAYLAAVAKIRDEAQRELERRKADPDVLSTDAACLSHATERIQLRLSFTNRMARPRFLASLTADFHPRPRTARPLPASPRLSATASSVCLLPENGTKSRLR